MITKEQIEAAAKQFADKEVDFNAEPTFLTPHELHHIIELSFKFGSEYAAQQKGMRWVRASEMLPDSWHLVHARFVYTKIHLLDAERWLQINPEPANLALVEWLYEDAPLETEKAEDLIKAQAEYIQLLIAEVNEMAPLAWMHGWESSRAEAGVILWNKINAINKDK